METTPSTNDYIRSPLLTLISRVLAANSLALAIGLITLSITSSLTNNMAHNIGILLLGKVFLFLSIGLWRQPHLKQTFCLRACLLHTIAIAALVYFALFVPYLLAQLIPL